MIRLMNAAVMPQEGEYRMKAITQKEFVTALKRGGKYTSYIGYGDTANFIQKISNMTVITNREQTVLESGDIMLICKLKYRVQNPGKKGTLAPTDEDYEFFRALYVM